MLKDIKNVLERVKNFEDEVHSILGIHETSPSRVVILERTYKELKGLNLFQDELFRQSLCCVENNLFRAAHVMAWAGFMDFLEEKIASDGFKKLKQIRKNWKFSTIDDLREEVPEYQLIDACKDLRITNKKEKNIIVGLLNKRHECAHPSDYSPDLNESLGYISELLKRIKLIQKKKL